MPTGSAATTSPGKKAIHPQGATREKQFTNPNRLRIIAGTAKGTKIDSPDVYVRPMMAKVCVTLFCGAVCATCGCVIHDFIAGA